MLKFLRQKETKKRVYWVLALIVIPSFVITGAVIFSPGDENLPTTLGRIGRDKITLQEYLDSYRAVQRQVAMVYGDRFDEVRRFVDFRGEAWDRILLLRHARREGVKVDDREVVEWIGSQEAFRSGDAFDLERYKRYVQAMGVGERRFEDEVREMLTLRKLSEELDRAPGLSDEELRKLYAERHARRDLLYSVVPAPEAERTEVPDADLEKLYEMVKGRLTAPERVKLRYLHVPASEAGARAAALADEGTLDAIAAAHGLTVQESPAFTKNERVPAFEGATAVLARAFALRAVGEESDWIKTGRGSFKIALAAREPGRPLTLEESKAELKRIASRDRLRDASMKRAKALRAEMKTPSDFEAVLQREKLEIKVAVKRRAGDPLGGAPLAAADEEALAALADGGIGGPYDSPDGAVLVKASKTWPLDEEAFAKEKEAFARAADDERSRERLEELLRSLRASLEVDLETMQKVFQDAPEAAPAQPARRTGGTAAP